MNLPGFTAEASLGKLTRTYRARYVHSGLPQSPSGIPANVRPSQLEATEGLEDLEEGGLMEVGIHATEGLEDLEEGGLMEVMDVEVGIDVEEMELDAEMDSPEEV
jgi:hypothetical protein